MKQPHYHSALLSHQSAKGFGLVELMIAMVLGLVLIGAATSVMLSNIQSFRANKSLVQMQDSARLGFELMARDIRQAGSIPCGNDINLTTIVSDTPWYLDWTAGSKGQLIGYPGNSNISGLTGRVDGTEALSILYVDNIGSSVESTAAATHTYTLNKVNNGFKSGDIVIVCDAKNGALFKANIATSSGTDKKMTVTAAQGNTSSKPGLFEKHSVMGKLKSRAWYIGTNSQGGPSLYLAELNGSALNSIEIAAGVSKLEFNYRLNDTAGFKTASEVNNRWQQVNAVKITLELLNTQSAESGQLKRSFSSIVALRNRIL
jgi:type IV pilus assembly protein PilW